MPQRTQCGTPRKLNGNSLSCHKHSSRATSQGGCWHRPGLLDFGLRIDHRRGTGCVQARRRHHRPYRDAVEIIDVMNRSTTSKHLKRRTMLAYLPPLLPRQSKLHLPIQWEAFRSRQLPSALFENQYKFCIRESHSKGIYCRRQRYRTGRPLF